LLAFLVTFLTKLLKLLDVYRSCSKPKVYVVLKRGVYYCSITKTNFYNVSGKKTMNVWQSIASSPPGLAVPPLVNAFIPSPDERLLYRL